MANVTDVDGAKIAHQQYVSSGKLEPELLRAPVFRAWERSHLEGASARRAKALQLDSLEKERLLEEQVAVIEAAKPYMQALSKAAGVDAHAAMLGDSRAIVLDVMGDEQSVHGPVCVPGPGALLSEGMCGANGIGSPLAEGGYVELVGPEHFIEGFHPFTCQGVPFRTPEGDIAGTISISVKKPEAGRRLREILFCAARGIEIEMTRAKLAQEIEQAVASPMMAMMDEALVHDLRQDILQSPSVSRLSVELAAQKLASAGPRLEPALRLLDLALRSMESFRKQSALFRELVSTEKGKKEPISLDTLVRDMVMLLQTEARAANITIDTSASMDTVIVEADRRETSRAVFRTLLGWMEQARGGGSLRVIVRNTEDGRGELLVDLYRSTDPTRQGGTRCFSLKMPLATMRLAARDT